MRRFIVGAALAAVAVSALSAATAAAPVQSLDLWSPRAGSYEVELRVSVVPHGFALSFSGSPDEPRRAVAVEYAFGAAGAATYYVTDAVGLSLRFQARGAAGRIVLEGKPPGPWRWEADGPELRFGTVWRRSAAGTGWRLELDYGGKNGVGGRLSYAATADPLVLSAGVDADNIGHAAREARLSVFAGVALAANDELMLQAAARHRPALAPDDLPETTLTLGAVRARSGAPPRHVGFETTVAVHGRDARLGFAVLLYGAGRH